MFDGFNGFGESDGDPNLPIDSPTDYSSDQVIEPEVIEPVQTETSMNPDGSDTTPVESTEPNQLYSDPLQETFLNRAQESLQDFPQSQKKPSMAQTAASATEIIAAAQTGDSDAVLIALEKFKKSQMVRFLDWTVLGPLMMWYAYKGRLSTFERAVLGVFGASTILYNLKNYQKNKKQQEEARAAELMLSGRV